MLAAQRQLSRKNIVFQMRNYDGGGHGLLEGKSSDYETFASNRGLGWQAVIDGNPTEFKFSALDATTRQIAHEIFETFIPALDEPSRLDVDYDTAWRPNST